MSVTELYASGAFVPSQNYSWRDLKTALPYAIIIFVAILIYAWAPRFVTSKLLQRIINVTVALIVILTVLALIGTAVGLL